MLVNRTESVTIPSGKNITLSLNSKEITGTITNAGSTITIKSNSEGDQGRLENTGTVIQNNSGIVNITNCTIRSKGAGDCIKVMGGTVNIKTGAKILNETTNRNFSIN